VPVDLDATVLAAGQGAFAAAVVYTPKGGAALTGIRGNFVNAAIELEFGEESGHRARQPTLGVRLAEFPAAQQPKRGDAVQVAGTSYQVTDIDADGEGHAWLILHLV